MRAHHLASTDQHPEAPSQSWHASHLQWWHGTCRGFVAGNQEMLPDADPAISMGYWTEADIPFYYGLARTFPLADRWFSSCLGPTFPNRGALDLTGPPAFLHPPSLPEPGLKWGTW